MLHQGTEDDGVDPRQARGDRVGKEHERALEGEGENSFVIFGKPFDLFEVDAFSLQYVLGWQHPLLFCPTDDRYERKDDTLVEEGAGRPVQIRNTVP
ncbi:MAG: hypothetical protein Q9219_003315 [cf. Caloplaca sp. 3 TL-2023]